MILRHVLSLLSMHRETRSLNSPSPGQCAPACSCRALMLGSHNNESRHPYAMLLPSNQQQTPRDAALHPPQGLCHFLAHNGMFTYRSFTFHLTSPTTNSRPLLPPPLYCCTALILIERSKHSKVANVVIRQGSTMLQFCPECDEYVENGWCERRERHTQPKAYVDWMLRFSFLTQFLLSFYRLFLGSTYRMIVTKGTCRST